MGVSRRKFINTLFGVGSIGSIFAFLYPVLSYLVPPKVAAVNVNSVKEGKATLFPLNSYKIVKFGRIPVILIKTKDDKFHALTATCTHLQCIVQFKKDTQQIWCACHNGLYDIHGRNISGPPPRPLTEMNVTIVKGQIIISKKKPNNL